MFKISNRRAGGAARPSPRRRGTRPAVLFVGLALGASLLPAALPSGAQPPSPFRPGAAGLGDPYFPLDGNGGYNVDHYDLELAYDPATGVLEGVATIAIRATQDLSRFNLDLDGLTVRGVTIDGEPVVYDRNGGELRITPEAGITAGRDFEVGVSYDGVPEPLSCDQALGCGGFIRTDDGVLVAGQPHVAATWFPVNDHPRDRAGFSFAVTVPEGLEVVANGSLESHETQAGETRWVWEAPTPMASYLATVNVGQFDLTDYRDDGGRPDGIDYVDAIDPDLMTPLTPRTGARFAFSGEGEQTYKRLRRRITVPEAGATLSFWVNRDTEINWDFLFVEAHTAGQNNWTTLPDANGHTGTGTGAACPYWLQLHPFLLHYQTDVGQGRCLGRGSTGVWSAASGVGNGWEQWSIDLARFAGTTADVAISYASDDVYQLPGVAVDDIEVSTGEGSTSFEADGDPLDGWAVTGAPRGSIANVNDWIVATTDDSPTPLGVRAQGSLDRQPEVIGFLSRRFGAYPFADGGAIIDDVRGVGFALETQTRPIYPPEFFISPAEGTSIVVHELAHQWFGNRVSLRLWRDIWLNEGFATYAEWLWSGREGLGTAQQIFDSWYELPADDPFWDLEIGDPGPQALFDLPVYVRGAMTLQALRFAVGDRDFFRILRRWANPSPGRTTSTANFIALAERVSGRQLDRLFRAWLHTTTKPRLSALAAGRTRPAPEGAAGGATERGPLRLPG